MHACVREKLCACVRVKEPERWHVCAREIPHSADIDHGVATINMLLKIIGLFCRIWSLL